MSKSGELIESMFWKVEPELVIEDFVEDRREVIFRLLDCDGYRLGRLVLSGVRVLCVATHGISYSGFCGVKGDDIQQRAPWLQGAVSTDDLLVVLTPAADCEEEDLVLPVVEGLRCGYILCRDWVFEEETSPGR